MASDMPPGTRQRRPAGRRQHGHVGLGHVAQGQRDLLEGLREKTLTACFGQAEFVAEAYLWLTKDGNATSTTAVSCWFK